MKKSIRSALVLFVVTLTLLFTTNEGYAQKNEKITKILKPEKESEMILENVEYTLDNEQEVITFSGNKKVNNETDQFLLDIDAEKGTYKVQKDKSKQNSSNKNIKVEDPNNIIKENEPQASFNALATTTISGLVTATTMDPVNAPLVSTTSSLSWYDYGTTIEYKSRTLHYSAGTSQFGTNWYVTNASYAGSPIYWNGKQNLQNIVNTSFYNYDFMTSSGRTDVSHEIEIMANNDSSYDYTIRWTKSGEGSPLLHLKVN